MTTLRQFTEGFYTGSKPKRARLECVFSDMLEELERQVTVKLFNANRTLTRLTAEHCRTIEVDNIHVDIFECRLLEKMKRRNRTVNLLSALVEVLPAHSIICRHPHGQQCNVTYRKPGQDLPGSNPVVSHFFTLIILYREAQNYSSCFLFSKTNGVLKPLQVILHYFGKIAHFDVGFTVSGVVLVSAGFLAPQSAFPTFLPLKHTQKRRKSANSGSPFSKTKERLQTLQATFDPSCPRLSSLGMTGKNE